MCTGSVTSGANLRVLAFALKTPWGFEITSALERPYIAKPYHIPAQRRRPPPVTIEHLEILLAPTCDTWIYATSCRQHTIDRIVALPTTECSRYNSRVRRGPPFTRACYSSWSESRMRLRPLVPVRALPSISLSPSLCNLETPSPISVS